ncbi:hypothetical protein [Cellulomonas chengniuliangii]|uniref:DUF2975 domain-containing protein n=1 Tax=Cellulomonas chengniuliangii TaxID=2968084 RepID=A0ABY5L4B6_9CELL|nr:hypothetical protein [Cellulomonas chengniuliangii]MCC2307815.1 hypothetical protein [Cellulomonas chengniuliangii]UUI75428.1 hypothetical protein NP064_00405 [Cellulomonas chengniuliangii]
MTSAPEAPRRTPALTSAAPVGALTVIAWLAVAVGVLLGIMSLDGPLTGAVPVRLTTAAPASQDVVLPCVEGWSLDGGSCAPAAPSAQWHGGAALPVRNAGGMVAEAHALGAVSLLAASPLWVGLIAGGGAGLALIPVLRATADGRPFARGNARGLAVASALALMGGALATAGPMLAAPSVIASIEAMTIHSANGAFDMPDGWIEPALQIVWWPVVVAALLAALAAVTHRGARLAADVEGLV